jgi:hypothetical protein
MQVDNVRLKISFSAREIEIDGSSAVVDAWFERLDPYLRQFAGNAGPEQRLNVDAPEAREDVEASLPAVFGEYLHEFPVSITDVDRALISGHFTQAHDAENAFTTRQVAENLREQGVRLSNPSEAVRRNLLARRVFKVAEGRFRVSQIGIDHLRQLRDAN